MMILGLITATLLASAASQPQEGTSWTVWADKVYTASGDVLEGAAVRVQDGKITAIAPGARAPEGANALRAAALTPGMIDLSVRVLSDWTGVEHEREVNAGMRAADAVDLFDERWKSVARTGVTTALVNPPDYDVIGGLGLAVKTAGGPSGSALPLATDLVVRGAIGSQPSARNHPAFGRPEDLYSRRPTTRMGVEWEHRAAFYAAAASRGDSARAFPGSAELVRVLDGELPFFVQAWTTQDIRTAVFLKEEIEREGLGQPRLVIDAAAEAWREPQLLVRSKVAVVLPPYAPLGRTGEGAFMAIDSAAQLHELGVPLALSAHGGTGGESLGHQAGWAMRGGLPFDAALEAVTIAPARMLGLDDRVGSLEVGKAADLVLWSGEPFEASSAVIGVLVDGRLVLDPRAGAEKAD
jgi:imidazolonepropionase-like amidohydrolase